MAKYTGISPLIPEAPNTSKKGENFPMYHNSLTDNLLPSTRQEWTKEEGGRVTELISTYKNTETRIKIEDDFSVEKLGQGADKLLCYCVQIFTANNPSYPYHEDTTAPYTRPSVSFPLRDYAKLIGYDIDPRNNSTKEKARVRAELKNAVKEVKKNLEILDHVRRRYTAGPLEKWGALPLISGFDYDRGIIRLDLGSDFAEHLRRSPITQFPSSLYLIDGRNDTAYMIGRKLCTHHNENISGGNGHPNKLTVETLLENSPLPSYKKVQESRKSWRDRISEPFENALEYLVKNGTLKDWKYLQKGGEELPEDYFNRKEYSFQDFRNLVVYFELSDSATSLDEELSKKATAKAKRAAAIRKEAETRVEAGKVKDQNKAKKKANP